MQSDCSDYKRNQLTVFSHARRLISGQICTLSMAFYSKVFSNNGLDQTELRFRNWDIL